MSDQFAVARLGTPRASVWQIAVCRFETALDLLAVHLEFGHNKPRLNIGRDIRRLSEMPRSYSVVLSYNQAYSVKNRCAKGIFGGMFRLGFHR